MNAIGLIELNSVARGISTWDTMVKAASVDLLTASTACPGKYIILIGGDVGAVTTSVERGIEEAQPWLLDSLVIPNIHPQVFPALTGSVTYDMEALGIIETLSVSSGIICADTAVKSASVNLIEIRIAAGLGGKSSIYLTGEVGAVESAIKSGLAVIKPDMVVDSTVIASPHGNLSLELGDM
ncbi:MAG: BMC domain-containing protein [Candidatus Eremiobacterota bacterium]